MVKNIKAVKDAYINEGSGVIDFLPTLDKVKPDVFVVNAEGGLITISMEPRRSGCSVVEGKDITPEKVKALADAADDRPLQQHGGGSGMEDAESRRRWLSGTGSKG